MNIEAVFFDLDGTLCDFEPAWRVAVDEAFDLLLSEVPGVERNHVIDLWQTGWADLLALLNQGEIDMAMARSRRFRTVLKALGHENEDLADRLDLTLGYRMLTELQRFDDTETLVYIGQERYVGIVTNGADDYHPDSQRAKAMALGLLERTRSFHASDTVGVRKPDPRILLEACQAAGVAPEKAMYVGDVAENDVLAANRAGMVSVLLWRAEGEPPQYVGELKPDHIVRSLDDLPALLKAVG
jgi:putative hydrolase of the HAD superfamily